MSKWRPTERNCVYVIPDIHGRFQELELILKRILPLRKSDGGLDTLIFLGDYMDRRPDGHLVLDRLIQLKAKYLTQVICLRGNHEDMFLEAIKPSIDSYDYTFWMRYGGEQTLSGYLERIKTPMENPYLFPRQRISSIVPKKHINFINSLKPYHETDEYIFVHGGCDPFIPLNEQEEDVLRWDRSLCKSVIYKFANLDLPWNKTIVTGHNTGMSKPIFRDKYVMLDDHTQLLVMEMNSREVFAARPNKERLVKLFEVVAP